MTTTKVNKHKVVQDLDHILGALEEKMAESGISTTYKGVCTACDQAIHGEVCIAFGKTWHPKHFVCDVCKSELWKKDFYERDGKPYCQNDYHKRFAPKCFSCKQPVTEGCIQFENRTWHPEHFTCVECKKPFGESGFHERNEKTYCEEDYIKLFAPKCTGCSQYITGTTANGRWHPECFICEDCKQPLEGCSFHEYENKPYCSIHYREKIKFICYACNKVILGRSMTAMGRKYHPDHFVCTYCGEMLNHGTFNEANGEPYCKRCFVKTIG